MSGDAQTGVVGAALGAALVVNVKSTAGAAMSGQAVAWSVSSGGGSLSQSSTASGADGNASVTWTLGGTVGAQTVTATAAAFTVTFTATATPGPVAQVVVTSAATTLEALEATTQLSAEIKDAFGNAVEGTVTWSSSDAAVLTVDADGLAKAVANGAADVVATSGELTGKATVTVAQAVATVEVTPENATAAKGNTTQLAAAAKDGNGFAVADALFAWTSSDATVATVDSTGLVTGVDEGSASIVAMGGTVSDTATVTVTPAAFKPTGDTEVTGTVNVAEVEIPAGVKVTLTGDAVINAAGNVTIAGTLSGDCVAATVNAGGDLTMTGSVTNSCADTTQTGGVLTVASGGELMLDGATLNSSGGILITNESPAAQLGASFGARSAMAAEAGTRNCLIREAVIGSRIYGAAGADGNPIGSRGHHGAHTDIKCDGRLTIEGGEIFSPGGGPGGGGTSTTSAAAMGGNGGDGGDIRIKAGGDVFFQRHTSTGKGVALIPGWGGLGGDAAASGKSPTATGGDAGRPGLPFIETPGRIVIVESEALTLRWDFATDGGDATATGDNGADATAAAPAEDGVAVVATGGRGSILGLGEGTTHLVGDLFKGTLENGNDMFIIAPAATGGGGRAVGFPGNGGKGNETFPDGGAGGAATLTGGTGNTTTLFDDRHGQFLGDPGRGGDILFGVTDEELGDLSEGDPLPTDRFVGTGGAGWADCRVGALKPGGRGGAGGKLTGIVGQPGSVGSTPGDRVGAVHYLNMSNGGDAGSGTNTPKGGVAGSNADVIGLVETNLRSFEPGADGAGCSFIMEPAVSVTSDENGHAFFIGLSPSQLSVTLGAGNSITISGNGNWVTVTGEVDASGNFTASGSGSVAGFPGVPVSFTGTLSLDADGRAIGIQSGTLTMDSTNSNLPANGLGQRHPAVYSVTGTKIG